MEFFRTENFTVQSGVAWFPARTLRSVPNSPLKLLSEEEGKEGCGRMEVFEIDQVGSWGDFINVMERLNFDYSGCVMLSLTQRCSWKCIFCYKNCPKSNEFDPKELTQVIAKLSHEKILFALTGGEPTVFPYWREFLIMLKGTGRATSFITNATGIRTKTFEDIELIISTTPKIRISILGTGKGAVKVTQSNNQKGLKVIEMMGEYLTKTEQNFTLEVNTCVVRENKDEVIPLLERLEQINEEYGLSLRHNIQTPILRGRMLENQNSMLSPAEFRELREEVQKQNFNLDYELSYPRNDGFYYLFPCFPTIFFEIEPDGYLYANDQLVRVGSWRKHRIYSLIKYYYKYGWKIALIKFLEDGLRCLIELPEFKEIIKQDKVLRLKRGVRTFFTKDGRLAIFFGGIVFLLNPTETMLFERLFKMPISILKEQFKAIDVDALVSFWKRVGVCEEFDVCYPDDVEIEEGEIWEEKWKRLREKILGGEIEERRKAKAQLQ